MRSRLPRCVILLILCGVSSPVVHGQENDKDPIAILRRLGLEESRVMDHLSWICDVHGPRLTGSPNLARAQRWALKRLKSFGLANAHLEE